MSTDIIILSDNKTGHLNQSKAVAHLTALDRKKIIRVDYKRKLYRSLLALLIHLPLSKKGCAFLLKRLLTQKSFQDLLDSPCRLVISAGASLHAVNLAVCQIHTAKSIVIMKPPLGRQKKYDLRIIPRHDNPKKHPNTVITLGAPTLMSEMDLDQCGKNLARRLNLSSHGVISLWVGGDSASHQLTVSRTQEIIRHVQTICNMTQSDLLVTASRRTPPAVNQLLKEKFGAYAPCKLLIIPEENQKEESENLVPAMMGLSNLILVTEDSVSMISEAASSGKKVIVIEIDRFDGLKNKYRRLMKALIRGGYITTCRTNVLDQIVLAKLKDDTPPKTLRDSVIIKQSLQKLL